MNQGKGYQGWYVGVLVAWGLLGAIAAPCATAQITPDNTLGNEGSRVTRNVTIRGGNADRIDGGAPRGSNLFHSFSNFNVNAGQRVYFANPAGVQNILTRVTGNTASDIMGTLGVDGSANLFLLNPNGIIFGPNAQLDVGGSFTASTAHSFTFLGGSEFSATTPGDGSLLSVAVPLGVQYGAIPPGAIANAGNLTVGQNLSLAGGSVTSSGQLAAPAGQLLVEGVAGDVQVRQAIAQTATLTASNNLILQESQLQTAGDLNLLAGNTVQVRDSVANPFVAYAGGDLTVQGNQAVDIFALNHPSSGLVSGGDMVLRSANTVGGDARYWSGGNFRIEQLDGDPGNLFSPHDPIILTNGNVTLGNYTGASLHILAGGSVTLGNVTITGVGDAATTINPNNTTLFNGSRTYADLANFNLTEFRATLNNDGTVRSVDPVAVPITINGSNQATLDVRAGVDWAALGGLLTNQVLPGTPPPTTLPPFNPAFPPEVALRADITLNGNVRIEQPAGLVLLTNQFSPSTLPGTIFIQGNVDTSTAVLGANGGDIRVYGRGDIVGERRAITGNPVSITLNSNNLNIGDVNVGGLGGGISLSTNVGNISLRVSNPIPGSGGLISLSTNVGNISLTNSNWAAGFRGNVGSFFFTTNNGNISLKQSGLRVNNASPAEGIGAGNISLATNIGNISLEDSTLNSSFQADSNIFNTGNGGNGGEISLATNIGNISLTNTPTQFGSINISLDSFSDAFSSSGNAGNGGAVSFATRSGKISLTNMRLASQSLSRSGNASNGGTISLFTHSGNIDLQDSNLTSYSFIGQNGRGNGTNNGGAISIETNLGNIFLVNSRLSSISTSRTSNVGNGGEISIETRSGNIRLGGVSPISSYSFSQRGNAGNGGAIRLSAERGTVSNSASLDSFSVSETGSSGNGGNVTLVAGSEISGLEVTTIAPNGRAGNVEITGFGDLRILNTDILTSQVVTADLQDGSSITVLLTDKGQAGDVTASSTGSLTFRNSQIESDTRGGNPAGDIRISANQDITVTDSSRISARTSSNGSAGDITFTAPRLVVDGNAQVLAETSSGGNGGSISITAPTSVDLRSGGITVQSNQGATGNAGDLSISTRSLRVGRGTQVSAQTFSRGRGGNILLQSNQGGRSLTINIDRNSEISAASSGIGRGGNMQITAPETVRLRGGGQLTVGTTGSGQAGNLFIGTRQLNINRTRVSAEAAGTSTAGNLTIEARDVVLRNSSQISASAASGAGGTIFLRRAPGVNMRSLEVFNSEIAAQATGTEGQAGNLRVRADRVLLSGTSNALPNDSLPRRDQTRGGLFVRATGSRGVAGNLTVNARQITVEDNASISASNVSSPRRNPGTAVPQGSNTLLAQNGGAIPNASAEVNESNSRLAVAATGRQRGGTGNVTINTEQLRINNGGEVTASTRTGRAGNVEVNADDSVEISGNGRLAVEATRGLGRAGNLTINTNQLNISNGEVTASTRRGRAGNVEVNADDSIEINGEDSSLAVQATGSQGVAGNLTINTGRLTLQNGSTATVDSRRGPAGNLEITANRATLDNGILSANAGAAGTNNANINLTVSGTLLRLQRSSQQDNPLISANATGATDGGNITINVENGFILTEAGINTDVTANASSDGISPSGDGGRVTINTNAIFGLERRDEATILSDITATSESGNAGTIALNTLNVDPTRGLGELPIDIVNTADLVADGCVGRNRSGVTSQGEFTSTGRGGLSSNPGDALTNGTTIDRLVTLDPNETLSNSASIPAASSTESLIVEAQGLALTDQGKVSLVSNSFAETPSPSVEQPATCTTP